MYQSWLLHVPASFNVFHRSCLLMINSCAVCIHSNIALRMRELINQIFIICLLIMFTNQLFLVDINNIKLSLLTLVRSK